MAKRKRRLPSRKQIIQVIIPPNSGYRGYGNRYTGRSPRNTGGYGRYVAQTTSSLILMYPLFGLILLVVFFLLAGYAISQLIMNFFNPIFWILTLLVVMAFKPYDHDVPKFSIIIGFLYWVIQYGLELRAGAGLCEIPIIGAFLCIGREAVLLIPRLLNLGIIIATFFIMIGMVEFFRRKAVGE